MAAGARHSVIRRAVAAAFTIAISAGLLLGAAPAAQAACPPGYIEVTLANGAKTCVPLGDGGVGDGGVGGDVGGFADISKDQQFYTEMMWLAGERISTGWTEKDGTRTYRALQPVNRDAMAAFLYRAAGSPAYAPPKVSPFADVSTKQLFYKEMAWLASQRISTGWLERNGTRTYRALQPVNRDAMAAFLYRAAGSPTHKPSAVSPFADVSSKQLFYKEMSWLASRGVSTGWSERNGTRTYRALQSVNRDAMAAFLYRVASLPPELIDPPTVGFPGK